MKLAKLGVPTTLVQVCKQLDEGVSYCANWSIQEGGVNRLAYDLPPPLIIIYIEGGINAL